MCRDRGSILVEGSYNLDAYLSSDGEWFWYLKYVTHVSAADNDIPFTLKHALG